MRVYSKTSIVCRSIILSLLVFSAWCCVGVQAMAAEWYVDAVNGNDTSNTGSFGAPFKSLSKAISSLSDGDIVYVAAGTYSIDIANSNENDAVHEIDYANVTFKGAGPSDVIVDGTGATNWTTGLSLTSVAANVTITGMGFSHFTGSGSGIQVDGGENVKILDCLFTDNGSGIDMSVSAAITQPPVIAKNTLQNCSNNGINISVSAAITQSPVIADNILDNCSYNGISIYYSSTGTTMTPVIRGNTIGGSASASNAIYLNCMSGTIEGEVSFNEIGSIWSSGIYIYGDMGNVTTLIASNRMDACSTGIYVTNYNGTSSPVIRNNLITNVAAGGYGIHTVEGMSGAVDPEMYFNTIDGGGATATGIYLYGYSTYTHPVVLYNCVTNFATSGIEKDTNLLETLTVDYNNANGSGANNLVNLPVANNIQVDPLYASDFSIPDNSPCADAVDADLVTPGLADSDIMGTSRPRAATSLAVASPDPAKYDIGCYEYPYQEYDFTMPSGTGLPTDYRLMTLPMTSEQSFATLFQNAFGTYNREGYRIFIYEPKLDPVDYIEMTEANFDSAFANWQGRSFWVISKTGSLPSQTHTFSGSLTGNKEPFILYLSQGWNLIALPWPQSSANNDNIQLANIMVDDGTGMYSLTDTNNSITMQEIWSYSSSGYTKLMAATDVMVPGQGYWLFVNATEAKAMVPPDNAGTYFVAGRTKDSKTSVKGQPTANETLTPPPPPGMILEAEGDNGCFIGTLRSAM